MIFDYMRGRYDEGIEERYFSKILITLNV